MQDQIKFLYPKDYISLDKQKLEKRQKFLYNHNAGFLCLAISQDEKIIVTGSEDTTVRVWDLAERKQVACFSEHKSSVRCVVVSKELDFAISGSQDKSLILWNLKKNKLERVLIGHF